MGGARERDGDNTFVSMYFFYFPMKNTYRHMGHIGDFLFVSGAT